MISYKLAKKLKDYGFPTKTITLQEMRDLWNNASSDDFVPMPSLSELISACGKIPLTIFNATQGMNGKTWIVDSPFNTWCAETTELTPEAYPDSPNEYWANSPEEAVAKLWLALNGKN